MANKKADELYQAGVSLWLDSLSREMLDSGWLAEKLEAWGLRGQTSNPTIFEGAVSEGDAYQPALRAAVERGLSAEQACWELMVEDVQRACDLFTPIYRSSEGIDGYVSLELDPTKAHETAASIEQGHEIWKKVKRPNLMLKVPATEGGLPVVEELIYSGYNVNVTLLFSVSMYRKVMERWLRGLERRVEEGLSVEGIASVASFFISRVDSEVDARLDAIGTDEAGALKGKAAVANARLAYAAFLETVKRSPRFAALEQKGAQIQRPLWASTSTKNPSYPDTLYVDELVGPNCVNTAPISTIEAALERGASDNTLTDEHIVKARGTVQAIQDLGIDLQEITEGLLVEQGVEKFEDSYRSLVGVLEKEMKAETSRSAG